MTETQKILSSDLFSLCFVSWVLESVFEHLGPSIRSTFLPPPLVPCPGFNPVVALVVLVHGPRVVDGREGEGVDGPEVRDAVDVGAAPGEGGHGVEALVVLVGRPRHGKEVQGGEGGGGGHLGVKAAVPVG